MRGSPTRYHKANPGRRRPAGAERATDGWPRHTEKPMRKHRRLLMIRLCAWGVRFKLVVMI